MMMVRDTGKLAKFSIDINRLLFKLALIGKMSYFRADFSQYFESICKHMVEKF